MTKDGHSVGILSGDLEVKDRLAVLDRFRDGFEKVLITTNVLARGNSIRHIDVSHEDIHLRFLENNNWFYSQTKTVVS